MIYLLTIPFREANTYLLLVYTIILTFSFKLYKKYNIYFIDGNENSLNHI